jgi:hypothetical protein
VKQVSRELLTNLYIDQHMPIAAIAAELGCSYGKINYQLHRLGIFVRSKSDRGTDDERFDRKWRGDTWRHITGITQKRSDGRTTKHLYAA